MWFQGHLRCIFETAYPFISATADRGIFAFQSLLFLKSFKKYVKGHGFTVSIPDCTSEQKKILH